MKSKISLLGIAFISGAMVMIFEIIGARILAPSIGTSFYVWTALIGFVLASLSLGYYLGGYWIDIHPKKIWIAFSLLGAALSLMIVFVFKDDVLSWIVNHVKGLKVSAVIASVVLFVPASVFFGTITPMIAKLLLKELDMAGKTMGNVFAFSSIGSLAGTFLAGFYLLPTFSLNYILSGLIVVSIVLASLIFLSENNWLYLLISLLILMIFYISLKNKEVKTTSIYEFESAYNSIKVFPTIDYHTNDSILIMQLGRQRAGAMSLTNRPLPFNYLYYFRLAEYLILSLHQHLCLAEQLIVFQSITSTFILRPHLMW
ncbi:MAG: hypothetical protein DRI74_06715 [Bacteroidetes bacterium]|nr:MAG: hypothetical protein DRI74_06715 [Bacteroidota bacterium]